MECRDSSGTGRARKGASAKTPIACSSESGAHGSRLTVTRRSYDAVGAPVPTAGALPITLQPVPVEALIVYTDGACAGNPGPGGWGWAVPKGPFGSGSSPQSTNQRMEVAAALEALRTLGPVTRGPIEIVSDSTYVVNCFRNKWWENWLARGWKNAAKQPVANKDLWEPLIEHVRFRMSTPGNVRFRWVKGHSGNPMNEFVDQLAVAACAAQSATTVVGLDMLDNRGKPPTEISIDDRSSAGAEARDGVESAADHGERAEAPCPVPDETTALTLF